MNVLQKKYGDIKSLRSNYFELGRSLLESKKYSRAEQAFLMAIKELDSTPLDWELKYFLGECYERQDRAIEAAKAYFVGASLDMENCSLLFDKINELLKDKNTALKVLNWMDAHTEIWKDVSDDNFKRELQLIKGKLHFLADKLELSNDFFNALSNNAPAYQRIKALMGLGQIHLRKEEYNLAKEKIELAISLQDPKHKNILLLLFEVKVLLALNNKDAASKKLHSIVSQAETKGFSPDLKIKVASYYLELSEWQQAILIIDNLETEDFNELTYGIKIESLIALYRYEEASELADTGLQSYPLNNHIFFLKIQSLIEGQLDIARGASLFTESFVTASEINQIKRELTSAINRRPDDNNAHFFIAFIYFLIGEEDQLVEQHLSKARSEGIKEGVKKDENKTKRAGYPSKGINVLDGLIKEDKGIDTEASAEFYQAGKKFYWEADYKNAIIYLKKTVNLDPRNARVYWHLADTLKLVSSIRQRPYNDPALLEEAFNVWDSRPKEFAIEDPTDHWSYLVGSRIHELRYNFVEENYQTENWSALLFAERAAIHKKESEIVWTDLGKCFTNVGLYQNSYYILKRAMNLKKDDDYIREEYTKSLLNLYKFEEAKQCLGQLGEKGYKYPAWQGFIAFMEGNYTKALDYFNTRLVKDPDDIWSRGNKMLCYWFDFKFTRASEIARQIMAYEDDATIRRQEETFIYATFIYGNSKEAIKIMEETVQKAGDLYYMNTLQCQIYLYDNQLEKAQEQFDYFLNTEIRFEALAFLIRQLEAIKKMSEEYDLEHHKMLLKTINEKKKGWVARIQAKLKDWKPEELSVEREINIFLEYGNHSVGSATWIALQAAICRLEWEAGHYAEAYHKYRELAKYKEEFTDVDVALSAVLKDAMVLKDKEINEQKFELVIDSLIKYGIEAPEIQLRLLVAYLGINDRKKAENQFVNFIGKAAISKEQASSYPFIQTAIDIIPNHKVAWALFDLIKSYQKELPELNKPDALQLTTALNQYWSRIMDPSQTQDLIPALEPIAIEISEELNPAVPDSEWEFINKVIPELREAFKAHFGIRLPGVRIRINKSLANLSYNILINEVPMTSGLLEKNMVFVPNNSGALDESSIPYKSTTHPLFGTSAAWVAAAFEGQLLEKNVEFWKDPYSYLKVHLEYIILNNLDYFFDIQYTYDYLLDAQEEAPELTNLASKIISNRSLLLTFNRVLKGLLGERVPIFEKEKILSAFSQKGLSEQETSKIIERIRLTIKATLPGNRPKLKWVELSERLEQLVRDNLEIGDRKTFLRIEPVICQNILAEIKELIGGHNTMTRVLVVSDIGLRYHIRKLVALEHADLMVLAKEEII